VRFKDTAVRISRFPAAVEPLNRSGACWLQSNCAYVFPPPQRQRHDADASTGGVLSAQETITESDLCATSRRQDVKVLLDTRVKRQYSKEKGHGLLSPQPASSA
jgi:hypothetical protein